MRHAEHVEQHREGQLHRNAFDEVARGELAAVRELVKDLGRDLLDRLALGLERARREVGARQLAEAPVVGRVHVQEVAHVRLLLPRLLHGLAGLGHALLDLLLEVREHGEARRVLPQPRLSGDRHDVGVLGDGPERERVRALGPEDGGFAAEPRPRRVRIAVRLIFGAADEVEFRQVVAIRP